MTSATIPLTADARERFLLAIADKVSPDRLAELHFFPPIRQGTQETGVAVVAATAEASAEATVQGSSEDPMTESAAPPESRHVVYMARYRWTRKGPERGKWESEIVAEADAPLVTVEAVVHGVRDRANEVVDPERMSGEVARSLIEDARCRITP